MYRRVQKLKASGTHQHVDVMHEVQGEHDHLHDEVGVVDVAAFAFPGALVVQIPEVNGVAKGTRKAGGDCSVTENTCLSCAFAERFVRCYSLNLLNFERMEPFVNIHCLFFFWWPVQDTGNRDKMSCTRSEICASCMSS